MQMLMQRVGTAAVSAPRDSLLTHHAHSKILEILVAPADIPLETKTA